MKAKRILFITSEMAPFVPENPKSLRGRSLPQAIQEKGHEIRTFSPKWGVINERRHQLHEVIRLSGMNLIINDTDHPLIIKVASIQPARMQIYFIDNDEYFHKRGILTDENGKEYTDNGERAIFYARGVLETVKKLRWVPDIIHCLGWGTSIVPILIKKAYQDEPSFCDTKVVFSATGPVFSNDLGDEFVKSIQFKNIKMSDYADITGSPCTFTNLMKLGVRFADGVILDDTKVDKEVAEYAKSLNIPLLKNQKEDCLADAYNDFYEKIMDL